MAERIDRRTFLILTALAPVVVLAACKGSADKKPKSLLEGATQADYNAVFNQLFETAKSEKDVKFETRVGGPEKGLLLIRFGEPTTSGLLVLEKGFRPNHLLGAYTPDASARTIDLIEPTTEGKPASRLLVANWNGQEALRFLPPEKYTNPEQGIVEPHKMTSKELGPFLARVIASFNSNRLPPLDQ